MISNLFRGIYASMCEKDAAQAGMAGRDAWNGISRSRLPATIKPYVCSHLHCYTAAYHVGLWRDLEGASMNRGRTLSLFLAEVGRANLATNSSKPTSLVKVQAGACDTGSCCRGSSTSSAHMFYKIITLRTSLLILLVEQSMVFGI